MGHYIEVGGGFVYDGNGTRGVLPIDEDTLKINESIVDSEIDPDEFDFDNPEELEGKFEKSNPVFFVLLIDGKNKCWNGVDNLTFIKDTIMSSSRNGLDDISDSDPIRPGSGASAPSRIFKSEMHSVAGGVDAGASSLTGGYSNNSSRLIQDIQDLNGDGYPDIIRESGIYYTNASGGHNQTQVDYDLGLHEAKSYAVGGSLGGGYVTSSASNSGDTRTNNKKANKRKGKQGNMSRKARKTTESATNSAGISGEFNYDQDEVVATWLDMNGDGLVDKIDNEGFIFFNRGYSFSEPVNWGITEIRGGDSYDYGGGVGINYANGSVVAGVSLNRTDNFTKFALEDLNGDGLPDHIESVDPLVVRFNTGTGFGPAINWSDFPIIEEGSSVGESVNTAFTVCINLLGFRICVNPNFAIGQGVSRQLKQFIDIDNDGQLDMLHSDDDGNLVVQRSLIGKSNLLRKVIRPLGGTIELDYEIAGNTYGLPFGKYVLKEIICDDGFDRARSPLEKTSIVYADGATDRFERQSFGFGRITMSEHDTENQDSVLRITEKRFYQDHFYTRGLLASESIADANGAKFVESLYTYTMLDPASMNELSKSDLLEHRRVFPALATKLTHYYEGADVPGLSHLFEYAYDSFGNISSMIDHGDGSDFDKLEIRNTYHHLDQTNVHNIFQSRLIYAGGKLLRKVEQEVDATGNILLERNFLDEVVFATTEYQYDEYGNLIEIIFPENANGERAFNRYTYDEEVHTYLIRSENHFGYTLENTFDFRFGHKLSFTDENAQIHLWDIDNRGRVVSYLDPLMAHLGATYTKRYSYETSTSPAYALVEHWDADLQTDIKTYQFIDGFLRSIQNKKTAVLDQRIGLGEGDQVTISGWRSYDALGRIRALYHPTFEPASAVSVVSREVDEISPMQLHYDPLDRMLISRLQDGSVVRNTYEIVRDRFGSPQFQHLKIDALENRSAIYSDVRGRKRATTRFDEEGEIWTTFKYNAIDELVQSTNHFNYHTDYSYDHFGRLVEKRMPDQEPSKYYYDLAGNMTHEITPNIRTRIPDGR